MAGGETKTSGIGLGAESTGGASLGWTAEGLGGGGRLGAAVGTWG